MIKERSDQNSSRHFSGSGANREVIVTDSSRSVRDSKEPYQSAVLIYNVLMLSYMVILTGIMYI